MIFLGISAAQAGQAVKNRDVVERWPSGKVKSKVSMLHGKKHGIATYYHANGMISAKILYKNDKRDGTALFFRPDGSAIEELRFRNGVQEGSQRSFYSPVRKGAKPKLKSIEIFKTGKLVSGKYFDLNGKPLAQKQVSMSVAKLEDPQPSANLLPKRSFGPTKFDLRSVLRKGYSQGVTFVLFAFILGLIFSLLRSQSKLIWKMNPALHDPIGQRPTGVRFANATAVLWYSPLLFTLGVVAKNYKVFSSPIGVIVALTLLGLVGTACHWILSRAHRRERAVLSTGRAVAGTVENVSRLGQRVIVSVDGMLVAVTPSLRDHFLKRGMRVTVVSDLFGKQKPIIHEASLIQVNDQVKGSSETGLFRKLTTQITERIRKKAS